MGFESLMPVVSTKIKVKAVGEICSATRRKKRTAVSSMNSVEKVSNVKQLFHEVFSKISLRMSW